MTKHLIVNADDLGISAGVNRGILEAHRDGIVTSTTVMVNMPDAAEGIRLAQENAPRLGLGLHLNTSFGAPVSLPERVPSLVTVEGTFVSDFPELREKAPSFTAEDLRAEFTAQMDRFMALAGHPPDHIDSHHAISYWHPAGFDVMLKLAAQYSIPIRSPERHLVDEAVRQVLDANESPRWPGRISHDPVFFDQTATMDTLRSILTSLPDGVSELVCHPGYAEGLNEAYAAPRENELRVLTDPGIRDLIAQEGITLITFADLPD